MRLSIGPIAQPRKPTKRVPVVHQLADQFVSLCAGVEFPARLGAGDGVAISVRVDLPDKEIIVEASANLRFNSGAGPAFLRLLAFDTRDNFQVIGQGQISDPSPDLIRNVVLEVTPTVVDNERWSYLFRWFPSHVESTRRDRPDAPEQLLWGARIGVRHGEA